MSKKKGGFVDHFYAKIAPIITGVGASVVILGALFKLMHWEGAGEMLIVGMGTEALIFLLFAFQPQHEEPDWSLVYPELDPESGAKAPARNNAAAGAGVAGQLDNMLTNSKVGPELIDSLGRGIQNLSTSVNKMSSLGDAFGATQAYTENVKKASGALAEITNISRDAMGHMAQASKSAAQSLDVASSGAKEYHQQIQSIAKNLGALNAVYEMELKDSNNHLKAMNNFYGNLTVAMENMATAARETQEFQGEMSKLTNNLSSLNNVYGSMLNAMRG
ncbi:type IX secretion system motor protein PorL/GldL [Aureibacter tunicatorum]|uniref:Gliding motility-associated protein GldL n=1 Tax=Aureibacter tunicatorum TaxID=866807 RepID=A0AAE4BQ55_9BACT|nr:gliding motility protein GldL [Aureibacter tunicatorum]MDR6237206.1 gliding motility-associated protein GldL [Aureibacter tunicatorum]BDD06198.1 hypothetical protein AUTU_36810 [Aureibacter tunicatorum]